MVEDSETEALAVGVKNPRDEHNNGEHHEDTNDDASRDDKHSPDGTPLRGVRQGLTL